MSNKINHHTLQELSDNKNEILLETQLNTELHISTADDIKAISIRKVDHGDFIGGRILIHQAKI